MDLAVVVYEATTRLPRNERFGLVARLQRAAVSVPSNIAEGHARQSPREFAQFLSIAIGSLAELGTQIELAGRLDQLDGSTVQSIGELVEHLRAMLLNLLAAVRQRSDIRDGEMPGYLAEGL